MYIVVLTFGLAHYQDASALESTVCSSPVDPSGSYSTQILRVNTHKSTVIQMLLP